MSALCGGLAALAVVAMVAAPVRAEPPPPAPAAPQSKPGGDGFLDALNRWLDESASNFKSGMKGTQETLSGFGDAAKDAAKAAKDATDALTKLPTARGVTGRELCQNAPNGSPDCRMAAESICHAKGFSTGRSLDTQSAQKCPARIWLSGRLPAEGECAVETHVVRAVCQ